MSCAENIGIGGVMAEVAWLTATTGASVSEVSVRAGLETRYNVTADIANRAVHMAEMCGVIARSETGIVLKARPK